MTRSLIVAPLPRDRAKSKQDTTSFTSKAFPFLIIVSMCFLSFIGSKSHNSVIIIPGAIEITLILFLVTIQLKDASIASKSGSGLKTIPPPPPKGASSICGHYKGIDERVIDEYVTDQFSVGDFVMTSGEIPALIILDSVSRLIPGALNNLKSVLNDSFSHQLLDHPHYTNPRKFRNRSVPEVLLNGNHRHIDQWRQEHRESRTIKFRPDLWEKYQKIKESESKNG